MPRNVRVDKAKTLHVVSSISQRRLDLRDMLLTRLEYVKARSEDADLATRLDVCISTVSGRSPRERENRR